MKQLAHLTLKSFLLLFASFLLFFGITKQVFALHPCAGPASGDWTLNIACILHNEFITINGNLTVANGGVLDLRDQSTIYFNGTPRYIYIYPGGTIYLNKGGEIGEKRYRGGNISSWSSTTSLPLPMREEQAVAYKGKMYITGGVGLSTSCTANIGNVYYATINSNGTLGSWTTGTAFSIARRAHGTTIYNDYIYVAGGSNGASCQNSVQYAHINSDGSVGSWAATTSQPQTRTQSSSFLAYGGYMYSLGGYTCSARSATVYYAAINSNGTLGSWVSTTSLPSSRSAFCGIHRGYIYCNFNGQGNPNYFYYAPINSNGSLGTWTAGSSATNTRAQITITMTPEGYFYKMGGYFNWPPTSTSNTVEYIKIASGGIPGSWVTTTGLPANRAWGAGTYYNGYLYYLGGDSAYDSSNCLYEQNNVYYTQLPLATP